MAERHGYPFCFYVRLRTLLRAELLVALVNEFKANVMLGSLLVSQRDRAQVSSVTVSFSSLLFSVFSYLAASSAPPPLSPPLPPPPLLLLLLLSSVLGMEGKAPGMFYHRVLSLAGKFS